MRNSFLSRALIALAACSSCTLTWAANEWTTYNLPGGRPHDLIVSNAGDVHAAYSLGVYRRLGTYAAYSLQHNFDHEVADLARDVTRAGSVYIAVPGEGLFRSHDDGAQLINLAPPSPIRTVATSTDGMTVYYGLEGGAVYRSTDAGVTFALSGTVGQSLKSIVVDGANANLVHALAPPYVARSTDGGATWTLATVDPSISSMNELAKSSGSTLVLATHSGLYRSTDNGATWARTLTGMFMSVNAAPSAANDVLTGDVATGQLYRSTDSGGTWSATGVPLRGAPRVIRRGFGTPGRIHIADHQSVQISDNLGATWAEEERSPPATVRPVRLVATDAVPNTFIHAFVGGDGDGLLVKAGFSQWERKDLSGAHALVGVREFNSATLAVRPDDPQSIYLGAVTRGIFRSTDGGTSWSGPVAGTTGISTSAIAFHPDDPSTMYAVVSNGTATAADGLYRSVDGGLNWSAHSVGLPKLQLARRLAIDPANPLRMFIAVGEGPIHDTLHGLYRSIDGGVSWTRVASAEFAVRDVAIDPSDSNRVYAATADGLAVSTDGGTTFALNGPFAIAVPGAESVSAVVIDPVTPSTIYAASYDSNWIFNPPGQPSLVLRSVDQGATWEVLRRSTTPAPNWGVSENFFVTDLLLLPGTATVLASTDGRGVVGFGVTTDLALGIAERGIQRIGGTASSTAGVGNFGRYSATNVQLTLTLPAAATNVSATLAGGTCNVAGVTITCSLAVLLPSAITEVEMSYSIPASYPTATAFPITVSVSMQEYDSDPIDNSITRSLTAWQVVDLGVQLSTSAQTVDRGQTVTYNLQVNNQGPATTTAPYLLFRPGEGMTPVILPSGCYVESRNNIGCELPPLAAGAAQSLVFTATVSEPGDQEILAQVDPPLYFQRDLDNSNNRATAALYSRPVGDLAVSIAELADPVPAGAGAEYQVRVRNLGAESMPDVVIALTGLPSPLISSVSNPACAVNGSSVECAQLDSASEVYFTVRAALTGGGSLTIQATASSHGNDTVASNNSAQETTTVTAPPSKKGGGGSVDFGLLLAGLLLAIARHRGLMQRRRLVHH